MEWSDTLGFRHRDSGQTRPDGPECIQVHRLKWWCGTRLTGRACSPSIAPRGLALHSKPTGSQDQLGECWLGDLRRLSSFHAHKMRLLADRNVHSFVPPHSSSCFSWTQLEVVEISAYFGAPESKEPYRSSPPSSFSPFSSTPQWAFFGTSQDLEAFPASCALALDLALGRTQHSLQRSTTRLQLQTSPLAH